MENNVNNSSDIFDDDYFWECLDRYFERCFKQNEGIELSVDNETYINDYKKRDNAYSNSILAMAYYDNNFVKQDLNKMMFYLKKAANQKSTLAYACLAICYYYGFVEGKDLEKSKMYRDTLLEELKPTTLRFDCFLFFNNLIKEASKLDDIGIYNIFAKTYSDLYAYSVDIPKLWEFSLPESYIKQVVYYLTQAYKLGDKSANFKLYKFFKDVVYDTTKANTYLYKAVVIDDNVYAKKVYQEYLLNTYGFKFKTYNLNNPLIERANFLFFERKLFSFTTFNTAFNLVCIHLPGTGATSSLNEWAKINNLNVINVGGSFLNPEYSNEELVKVAKNLITYITNSLKDGEFNNVILFDGLLFYENYCVYQKILPLLDELGGEQLFTKIALVACIFYPWKWGEKKFIDVKYPDCEYDSNWSDMYGKTIFKYELNNDFAYKFVESRLLNLIKKEEKKYDESDQKDITIFHNIEGYKINLELLKYVKAHSKLQIIDFEHYFNKSPYNINLRFMYYVFCRIAYLDPYENISEIENINKSFHIVAFINVLNDYEDINKELKEDLEYCALEYEKNNL